MDYQKLFDLTGKVIVVTGAYGWLGKENCHCLKQFGATVIPLIRNAEKRWKEDAGSDTEPLGEEYVECDIKSVDSIREAYRYVDEKYGKIDVLDHCASFGGGFGKDSQLEYMSDETWQKCLDGGIEACFRVIREVVPYMKKNGGGSIIDYSSMYGLVSSDLRIYGGTDQKSPPSYAASKSAIAQFTRYAAGALALYNIRVNTVTPGPFPATAAQEFTEFIKTLGRKTMIGRIGQPHEMAGAVLLLASDASSFMTGSNIVVDGGWTAW